MFVYDILATSRACACVTIGPWSNAIGGSALDRMPAGVRRQLGRGGGGHQAEERRGDHPRARHPVRVGEHRELLQVGDLPQIHLLGELTPHGTGHVLVVTQPSAGQ